MTEFNLKDKVYWKSANGGYKVKGYIVDPIPDADGYICVRMTRSGGPRGWPSSGIYYRKKPVDLTLDN